MNIEVKNIGFLVFKVIFWVFLIVKFKDFNVYMVICWKVCNMEFVLVCVKDIGIYFINSWVIFYYFGWFYNKVLVKYFGVEFNCGF